MNSGLILWFALFETLLLSFGDARAVRLASSSPPAVLDSTNDGIVATANAPTRIQHISRATDQASATLVTAVTPPLQLEANDSIKNGSLAGTERKTNSTGERTLDPAATDATTLPPAKLHIKHIRRKRTTLEATMPFNFFTLHTPCDFDLPFHELYDQEEHCQWLYNNRYQHSGYFGNYMLFKAEAFFFGQYHERLRRYEWDPREFAMPEYD